MSHSEPKPNKRKLTATHAEQIRFLANEGVPLSKIANAYGVSPSTVTDIIKGRLWKRKK